MKLPTVEISNKVDLAVDWIALGSNLANVFAGGLSAFAGSPDGAVSSLSSLIAMAGNVKSDEPPSEKAWQLFWLSLAWTVDDLRRRDIESADVLSARLKDLMKKAAQGLGPDKYELDSRFLSRPTTQPIYRAIRDQFSQNLDLFQTGAAANSRSLKYRFDHSFNRAVFEIWSKRPELFQSLRLALEAPGSEASAFDVQWDSYRKRLVYDFESRPVFGQEESNIALAQLYVPLRGFWRDKSQEAIEGNDVDLLKSPSEFVSIDTALDKWASDPRTDSPMRLIGGGPGSGKSTTLKAFARRLADDPSIRLRTH